MIKFSHRVLVKAWVGSFFSLWQRIDLFPPGLRAHLSTRSDLRFSVTIALILSLRLRLILKKELTRLLQKIEKIVYRLYRRQSIAQLLIENTTDVNAGDCNGSTPLHVASCQDMSHLSSCLLRMEQILIQEAWMVLHHFTLQQLALERAFSTLCLMWVVITY